MLTYICVRTKQGGSFGDPAMSNIEQYSKSLDCSMAIEGACHV